MYSLAPAWIAATAARASVPVPQATTGVRMRSAPSDATSSAIDRPVDHDEIGAPGAQHVEPLGDRVRLGHRRAALHGDPGGGDELAAEPADDEETHLFLLRSAVAA
jgi:hypothetical protein